MMTLVSRVIGPDVLNDIARERERQEAIGEAKRAQGIDWRSCADPNMEGGDLRRNAVLGEEAGEVANAILEADYANAGADPDTAYSADMHLREELIQVAAVAAAWVQAIDARWGLVPRGD